MTDLVPGSVLISADGFEEGVPAEARILLEPVTRRHMTDAVAEEAAEVAHLLPERRRRAVGIVFGVEQERVPALDAHIFMAPVAVGQLFILMLAEEARQRVTDARDRSVLAQVSGPAPAPPVTARRPFEDVIVDVMSPERARQFGQYSSHDIPSTPECAKSSLPSSKLRTRC